MTEVIFIYSLVRLNKKSNKEFKYRNKEMRINNPEMCEKF